MKILRIAGLLGILLSVYGGMPRPASASGINCSVTCSGHRYSVLCFATLSQCCGYLSGMCPDPEVYEGGGCTDGVNYC
jgi:hypothetical protein